MNTFSNWEDVALFDTEEAEALFWSENRPDLRLMESAVSGSGESQESVAISLRIDPRMLARIKRLARTRFLNYQSMIKQWLSERMEEEMAADAQPTNMKNQNRNRNSGFTLIELLVVIAIIGILAGLVTALSVTALQKSKIHRVQAEMAHIKTAIENYKAKKGFYPPDNPNNSRTNALYYELSGATFDGNSLYTTLDGRDSVANTALQTYCGVGGIANASTGKKGDDNFTAESFIVGFKFSELETVAGGVLVIDVPVNGVDKSDINPWYYNSSHPTNNPDSYDLWAEFLVGSKTNIICNWSEHVIVK
ncbi:MAG: prepilin-type N-terminal cleavage/methylation domain-containing protein [Verrucomicrobia bacterium]|nr:prepilin-type N-terminal cleavage/methylation domain-containing protein [Verrucomicrobiota bacterium]